MRRRLWWMRARLDGRPAELFWKGLAPVTLGTVGVSAALDAFGVPSMWWAMMLAPPVAWLISGGWRTPTIDKVIREV